MANASDSTTEYDSGADDDDRLWAKTDSEMQTLGYRTGLAQGEEETLQEGFSLGYCIISPLLLRLGCLRGKLSAHLFLTDAGLIAVNLTASEREERNKLLSDITEFEKNLLQTVKSNVNIFNTKDAIDGIIPTSSPLADCHTGFCNTNRTVEGKLTDVTLADDVGISSRVSEMPGDKCCNSSNICDGKEAICCQREATPIDLQVCRNFPSDTGSPLGSCETVLTPVFAKLIQDAEEWVQKSELTLNQLLKEVCIKGK